jgi:hypothetical protein
MEELFKALMFNVKVGVEAVDETKLYTFEVKTVWICSPSSSVDVNPSSTPTPFPSLLFL